MKIEAANRLAVPPSLNNDRKLVNPMLVPERTDPSGFHLASLYMAMTNEIPSKYDMGTVSCDKFLRSMSAIGELRRVSASYAGFNGSLVNQEIYEVRCLGRCVILICLKSPTWVAAETMAGHNLEKLSEFYVRSVAYPGAINEKDVPWDIEDDFPDDDSDDSEDHEDDELDYYSALENLVEGNVSHSQAVDVVSDQGDETDWLHISMDTIAMFTSQDAQFIVPKLMVAYKESALKFAAKIFPESPLPEISFISHLPTRGFFLRTLEMKGWPKPEENDLRLHYGSEMPVFHSALVEKMNTDKSKGVVLFDGPPGTGKTFYVRRLCYELTKLGRTVVLLPGSLIPELAKPAFTEFMMENFEGSEVVLIAEDSESLLVKRDENDRDSSSAVSTLLNMADGILNDVFSVQIVATFNTDLKNLDQAVLRRGRLFARHYFGPLSNSDAKSLASHIGVDSNEIGQLDMTLADVYSLLNKEQNDILTKSVRENR